SSVGTQAPVLILEIQEECCLERPTTSAARRVMSSAQPTHAIDAAGLEFQSRGSSPTITFGVASAGPIQVATAALHPVVRPLGQYQGSEYARVRQLARSLD